MNRIVKTTVLAAAVAATSLTTLPAAYADGWRHHHRGGDLAAAGIIGLAAGALAAGIATAPDREYYEPERVYRPVRRHYVDDDYGLEPWTRDWYRYCANRYRTFNARTGTFMGSDGYRHFCEAD